MLLRRVWSSYGLPLLLLLWGWVMVWSALSGRLDLLLRGIYHPVVLIGGGLLLLLGALQWRLLWSGRARSAPGQRPRTAPLPRGWQLVVITAVAILLLPPRPSFNDLAISRPPALPEAPRLAFVLPPEQRTLTEWVRLLRNQSDPKLVDGNPVNISGFVWHQNSGPPLLARLTVRCCLADATPSGLAVAWPDGEVPQPDQWLAIRGTMAVEQRDGEAIAVVVPKTIRSIPRPRRPLEP